MRTVLVSRQLASDRQSGIVTATVDLARALSDAGDDVLVVTEPRPPGAAAPAPLDERITVHEAPGETPLDRAVAVHESLDALHRERPIDVVCAPLWGCEGLVAVHDARFPTVISCMTSAAVHGELNPEWARTDDARALIALEDVLIRSARHLHGLTRASLDHALSRRPGAPLTSAVVRRGLRDHAASNGHATSPAPPNGTLDLLFVGRREPRKGVDVLLHAFADVARDHADVTLTLAGAAREPGDPPEDRVRFLGPVSPARLHELLAKADVVCQPSRYESHGIVLVEAMMFGRPLVSTRSGGIPEVVEAGGNALLAEPGDPDSLAAALRTVVGDAALRRRMAARSRELYLERYDVAAVAAAMRGLFADAISAHRAHPAPPSAVTPLAAALVAERERTESAEAARDVVEGSRSWRLTSPLRRSAAALRARRPGR